MYTALKTHHHLKHWGRQQLGLFLKGIGLTLEDALTFWRTEFTKKPEIDLDSVRHCSYLSVILFLNVLIEMKLNSSRKNTRTMCATITVKKENAQIIRRTVA